MSNFFLWPWNHNGSSKASTLLPRYADPDELYIRPPHPKSTPSSTSIPTSLPTSTATSSQLPHPQSLLPPPPPDTHPNNTTLDSHISITHDTNWDILVESTPQQVATSEAHDLMLRLVHHDESKYVNRLMNIMSTFRDNFGALTAEYQPFKLIEKTNVSHNTIQFRFALPSPTMRLGLPVGKHMLLKFTGAEDKPISRPYTPVTSDHQLGYFDLMIKIYDKGLMSQHLKALPLGGTIDIRGPLGSLTYHGQGSFTIKRKTGEQKIRASQIGMIAGGTGITPMLQIIREICRTTSDDTLTSLIFANVTSDDILCKKELDECAEKRKNIKVAYTLDKPTDSWTGFRGFITPVMIQQVLPAPANDTLILICGPKPMTDMMCKHLESLDYKPEQYFVY